MRVLYIRHGQTEWNVLNKLQGRADVSLNKNGIEQAYIAKEGLKNEQIDLIMCSPLKRAKETAEIINEDRKLPLLFDDRLMERDFGELEGMLISDLDYEEVWSYKKNTKYIRAECMVDFFDRVYGFLDDIKPKYKDKSILLVAHGGVSIPVKCYFNGIPDTYTLQGLISPNCAIAKYEC